MGSVSVNHDELNSRSEQLGKRTSSKRILGTALASVLIVGAVIFLAVGVHGHDKEGDKGVRTNRLGWGNSTSNAVKEACSSTLHPELCVSSLLSFRGLSSQAGSMEIVNAAVSVGVLAVEKVIAHARSLYSPDLDFRQRGALQDCMEMFDDTLDQLNATLSNLHNTSFWSMPKHAAELQTLLSAAITNQYTCLEGFQLCKGNLKHILNGPLSYVSNLVSNSLAMVGHFSPQPNQTLGSADSISNRRRRLLSEDFIASDEEGYPSWMSAEDRRLLRAPAHRMRINAVVAADGSGHHSSIQAAVDAAPEKSKRRYVIHIKAGMYQENVDIPKKKPNLMFIGDGKHLTVVTSSRNVHDGYTTFRSATVAVTGQKFIARDITFQNTAGPAKNQAVALRVGSDFSAFYRCSIKGFQDTLYVHSLRQFYRDCDVHGTVDFIFGNAAVVLQNCNLMARRPSPKQKIVYTAQGREDPNQNTGISIHNCRLLADPEFLAVKRSFQAFLGRPWRKYSRTVIIQSYLGDLIQPAGWYEWAGNFALDTLYYGEYKNYGPGAGTANRVKWRGHHVIRTSGEASRFTVGQFIQGNSWLPSTGVQYSSGLI
ncbi:hypothetical protein SUGI_0112020 [Cryptomeria japonica]|uniref:pectinesterase n=1 Tax=Cryptomeria japonica TaxID=3369 RepID=UPI002408E11B|nr:pectinesterase [Cryptomeria japonica]GLJ09568.1 hypothetical protein SUGI_0112020 [Cryptomeria japonica]